MSGQARKHKQVVLVNSLLESMANSKQFTTPFPILKKILNEKQNSTGCGGCPGSNVNKSDTFQTVKEGLAGLATKQKSLLKELLDTDKVQIVYRGSSGKAIQLNF